MDISRNLTSVEFGEIPRLVKSGGFFRCRVDSYRNFKLVNSGGFFRF